MVAWCLPFSHCIAHWPHYYWRWSQVKSRGSLFTSGSKLNVPRDSMACLDHVTLPKRTHYGTCKSKKLHTARPTAPATSPAGEANPVYACTPSSKAMAARGVPHGIMRACALTTGTLRAASACDVAIARTGRATTAMPPRHMQNRSREGGAVRRHGGDDGALDGGWPARKSSAALADRVVRHEVHTNARGRR